MRTQEQKEMSEEWLCVAEGEGVIELSGWGQPISLYPEVLRLHNDCESFGFEPPLEELKALLGGNGISIEFSTSAYSTIEQFLADILGQNFRLDLEHWDSGQPSCSGASIRAYVRSASVPEICRVLDVVRDYLEEWRHSSGLKAQLDAFERAEQCVDAKGNHDAHQWESDLYASIVASVDSASQVPYCRLNFLVVDRTVFFINSGWWHSLGGDPMNVAQRLVNDGVRVVRCKVLRTKKGWVPYFARTAPEQKGFGWWDESLVLQAASETEQEEMMSAWHKLSQANHNEPDGTSE
jgi:hypothetical protein